MNSSKRSQLVHLAGTIPVSRLRTSVEMLPVLSAHYGNELGNSINKQAQFRMPMVSFGLGLGLEI